VIVVIGSLRLRGSGTEADAAGLAASIAIAAANEGARVELIGKVGNDPAGDSVLLALTRQRVGHVAILRDPARRTTVVEQPDDEAIDPDSGDPSVGADQSASSDRPALEAADVGLALRYLPEIAVIVAVHLAGDLLNEAIAAAGWADTSLVVIVPEEKEPPGELQANAVTVAAGDLDESGVGAAIGRYAAALDRGVPADAAYATLLAAGSV
jgi:ribokinase